MTSQLSSSDEDSFCDSDRDQEDFESCGHDDDEVQACKPKLSKHLLQLQQKLGLYLLLNFIPIILLVVSNSDNFNNTISGLEEMKKKLATKQEELKQSKPSPLKPEPLVVVYQDPRKRRKLKNTPAFTNDMSSKIETEAIPFRAEEFNLIKAKHDVKKFTIKALKKSNKRQARIALAVSLGALPPKTQSTNYKVLKQCKKKEIAKEKKLKESEHVFIKKVNSLSKKKVPKRDRNKVVNFDASFGKYGPKLKKQIKTGKSKNN